MQTNVTSSTEKNAKTTDAMYQYMVDCGFGIRHLDWLCLTLAMEYVYQPTPRFWRDFKVGDLLDAVTRLIPGWQTTIEADSQHRMLGDIQDILRMYAFDEENAQRLLELPVADRPADAESTSNWICRELESAGRFDDVAYARPDGDECGQRVLDMLSILFADADQWPELRIGTLVAHAYRDAIMQRQKAHI
ncbi:hypothetical protein [Paraburkholderia tropica]|uniref:hypothetical protein n=1 Tax=Paraburkholderia tropica TaxID=92647 RepID=UPI002ABD79E5|nr:hypothetical protein [Paraburkholderia tropica]